MQRKIVAVGCVVFTGSIPGGKVFYMFDCGHEQVIASGLNPTEVERMKPLGELMIDKELPCKDCKEGNALPLHPLADYSPAWIQHGMYVLEEESEDA